MNQQQELNLAFRLCLKYAKKITPVLQAISTTVQKFLNNYHKMYASLTSST